MNAANAFSRHVAALVAGLGLLLVLHVPVRAQNTGRDAILQLQKAFEQGSPEMLLGGSSERLDITLFGASAIYSRAQAQYVMKNFFREYPPVRFRLQEPSQREDNWFVAGSYWYGHAADPLWVYVRLRRQGDSWELREIRIDRQPRSY